MDHSPANTKQPLFSGMTAKELDRTAECINLLGAFCGPRDLSALSREALCRSCSLEQADVFVLFGGSILSGGDLMADAIRRGLARTYVIVGGEGHTTEALRRQLRVYVPDLPAACTEAEAFDAYLRTRYGVCADYLETRSTNCGNNVTLLLALLKQYELPFSSMILMQDASMQRRMEAGLRRYLPNSAVLINYASYEVKVLRREKTLYFDAPPSGMWTMERYLSLLLGEIPRLRDDAHGYGPRGSGYIAHVEIPKEAEQAFAFLSSRFGSLIRKANPLYAQAKQDPASRSLKIDFERNLF